AKDGGNKLEEGILHRVGATALRLTSDLDSAEWFAGKAREILTGLGSRYELAKLDQEEAEIAAARGRAADADKLLTRAVETFADLGARWDLNRARARRRQVPATHTRLDRPRPTVGLDLLLDLTQASGNLEVGRLLEIALDRLLDLTRFERGFILLLDGEGRPSERMRRVRAGARAFERDEAEFSGTIVRRVAAGGEAVSVADIAQEADLRQQKSVVALGLRQIMCAPMRARGRVIGIVYIDSRRLSFDEEHGGIDLAFLEAFAAQLSLAIENARLVGEEGRQAELLSVLAHEVRNPLSGILGYSDMGETGGFTAEAGELFGHIRRDAVRLKRLVDNVLELARHESGNVDWSMAPFDMGPLLEETASSFRPQCELKQIELAVDAAGVHRHAMGNPDRILQVLANLCGNAVKFTPTGGRVTMRARVETVSAADPDAPPMPATDLGAWAPADPSAEQVSEFIRVDVTDTGPGLTEETRQRLFQKFAQAAGKQRTKGVGIGLYISRNIVVRHGGTIFVSGEPGKGATFSFRIPVAP
ncbi:MAG TPA: GAF domain-containing sensor histidine kinase, partial [Kofleriaceae bacterium]|nr:GAF domain-containing sensor histidine kinase [Kofleriaceae bacterium]